MKSTCAKPQSVPAITFSRPTSSGEADDAVGDQARVLDGDDVVRDHAGDQDPVVRQLPLLPHAPFVLVARIRRLDRVGAGLHLQHDVDDVLERRVRDVRHVPAAEAHVIADAVLGDAFERVVERLDAQLRPFAVVLAGSSAPARRTCSRAPHRPPARRSPPVWIAMVFLAQRVGDREDVVALGGVVLVDAVVGRARRRDRSHEQLFHFHAGLTPP